MDDIFIAKLKKVLQNLIIMAVENEHVAAEQVLKSALYELRELTDDTLH